MTQEERWNKPNMGTGTCFTHSRNRTWGQVPVSRILDKTGMKQVPVPVFDVTA